MFIWNTSTEYAWGWLDSEMTIILVKSASVQTWQVTVVYMKPNPFPPNGGKVILYKSCNEIFFMKQLSMKQNLRLEFMNFPFLEITTLCQPKGVCYLLH